MRFRSTMTHGLPTAAGLLLCSLALAAPEASVHPSVVISENAMGMSATISTAGPIDMNNPFFQSLGSNGRSCGSCHQADAGWTITPANLRARFDASQGTDPVFRTNDGANSPLADVSTVDARRIAYSMLLAKGLIRVGIGVPANAEFDLVSVDDPYGYASAKELSLFRRPLPSTNLKFLSTVMWDGRETFKDAASTDCTRTAAPACFATLHFNLSDQANTATLGHAQGAQSLTQAQSDAIVAFETSLYTAQIYDDEAGSLTDRTSGGPQTLIGMAAYFGINDVLAGDYVTGAAFNPVVFDLFGAWSSLRLAEDNPQGTAEATLKQVGIGTGSARFDENAARRAVARGQLLFNSKPINITAVKGLNDDLGLPVIAGTCTTCHDTPGAGNHSIPAPLDIGLADASRRTPDLPLYTLRNKASGATVQVTDPGRALVTGKWNDIGRFKGPTLRALATRAPYFHNGFASDLVDVVEFYNTRFNIGFTPDEKDDLVAFLLAL